MVGGHCTERRRFRPAAWLRRAALAAVLAAGPAIAAAAGALVPAAPVPQSGASWMRIESRIEGGYFRQDAAALRALAVTLSTHELRVANGAPDEKWRDYYSALLAYRLALLAKTDEARAWPLTQRCISALNDSLALDADSAEALALQSACLALQSHLDPWRSPFAAPRSQSRIDKALKLAPRNPRVLLLDALGDRQRPKLFGGDTQRTFALLQRSVSAFEAQHPPAGGLPDWGAADAFTCLAQEYLTRGDTVAARNMLERALLVAPNYTQARSLMAEIVSG